VGCAVFQQNSSLSGTEDFNVGTIRFNALPNWITQYNSKYGYPTAGGPFTLSTTPKDFFAYRPIMLDIICMCYLGFRGGMRIKAIPTYNSAATSSYVADKQIITWIQRIGSVPQAKSTTNTLATGSQGSFSAPMGKANTAQLNALFMPDPWDGNDLFNLDLSFGGAMSVNGKTLEVQFPYSSPFLYINSANTFNQGNIQYNQNYAMLGITGRNLDLSNAGAFIFKAAADDFNVFYWIGAPPVYLSDGSNDNGFVSTALGQTTFTQ